jgi:hypothetical protein
VTQGLKPHSAAARKAVRRQEAEERQVEREKAILAEMFQVYMEKDGPEDEIRAQAIRNIDATQKARYDAQKGDE